MIQRSIGSGFGHILMMFNSSSDGGVRFSYVLFVKDFIITPHV